MSGKNSKGGLGALLKTVNDTTRAVNNVQRTTKSVKQTVSSKRPVNQAKPAKPDKNTWTCACGTSNTTKFCGGCGKAMPTEVTCASCGWKRSLENSGMKFCGECGAAFETV